MKKLILVLVFLFVSTASQAEMTFDSAYYGDPIYWNQPWVTQGLHYADGAIVDKVDIVLKEGMTNDKVLFEFFKGDYAGSGVGETLIYSEVFDVTVNTWGTYDFSGDVVLDGDSDGTYYMKISPSEGGVVHAFVIWGDDGLNLLRHGTMGAVYISGQEPISSGEYDYAGLRVYTEPVPEPATMALLGIGSLSLFRRRKA